MHSLGDMAKALNRPAVYLRGLQSRFELATFAGPAYPAAYLAFLRTVVFLRVLNVAEESLRNLWDVERKLLRLLHVDSTGSPTWYLDSCGRVGDADRRLLLSNHDMGIPTGSRSVQLGLDFAGGVPELFGSKEMGEDVLRVLGEYLRLAARIRAEAAVEVSLLRSAIHWAARLE
jgi:hypothetical protein